MFRIAEQIKDGLFKIIRCFCKTKCGMGLRVNIDEQDFFSFFCQAGSKVYGCGCFSAPSLLIDNSYFSHIAPFVRLCAGLNNFPELCIICRNIFKCRHRHLKFLRQCVVE